MRSKVRVMVAMLVFIAWVAWTQGEINYENVLWEGVAGAFVFLAFIFYSKFYGRQWVYYIFLVLLGVTKYYTEAFSYFFYFVTAMVILGYYLKQEIQGDDYNGSGW